MSIVEYVLIFIVGAIGGYSLGVIQEANQKRRTKKRKRDFFRQLQDAFEKEDK